MEDIREHLKKLLDPDKMVRFEALLKINNIITEASLTGKIQKFVSNELVNSLINYKNDPETSETAQEWIIDTLQKLGQSEKLNKDTRPFMELKVESEITVRALLDQLKIPSTKFLAILVDGKKADLDQVVRAGQQVILLPLIAGG